MQGKTPEKEKVVVKKPENPFVMNENTAQDVDVDELNETPNLTAQFIHDISEI